MYGRNELEWDELTAAGEQFLIERAKMGRTTSYTEFNTVVADRTGLRGFDFDREDERAALGHLLYLIVERTRPDSGLMLSALVQYLNSNDAGSGFYQFAQELGLLQRSASADQKLQFWLQQIKRIHAYYGGAPR